VPLPPAFTAVTITNALRPLKNKPQAIFVMVEGSFLRKRSQLKNATISGVSKITQPGFMLWLKLGCQIFETFPGSNIFAAGKFL
jgi:hypothetical protein